MAAAAKKAAITHVTYFFIGSFRLFFGLRLGGLPEWSMHKNNIRRRIPETN